MLGQDQFQLVWDQVKNEQVHGIDCCSVCKSSLLHNKMTNGLEKSQGTKNMLDHVSHLLAVMCCEW